MRRLAEFAPLVALLLLAGGLALGTDRFLTPGNLTNVLTQASILAVLACGMTVVIVSGGFDLSVGSNLALSGCLAALAMTAVPAGGIPLGVAVGILSGAGIGLLNGALVAGLGISPFIATLATLVAVRGLALMLSDGAPIEGEEGLPEGFVAYGVGRLLGLPLLVWTSLALALVVGWCLHRTAWGLRIFAVGGNREAAFLSGVGVRRHLASAYVACGALAGAAGVMMTARLQSGQPTAGEFYELTAIAAVVLGGASLAGGEGRLWRSMIGVLIMTTLGNGLNLLGVGSYWQRVAIGAVIVAAAALDRRRSA